jgi:hypothetical protein
VRGDSAFLCSQEGHLVGVTWLDTVELQAWSWSAVATSSLAREVDCSRFSPDNGSRECEERLQTGMGAAVVLVVFFLVVGFVIWRWLMRKYAEKPTRGDPGGPT